MGDNITKVGVGDFVSGERHVVDETCYQCRSGKMHICRNLKILGVDLDGAFVEYIRGTGEPSKYKKLLGESFPVIWISNESLLKATDI